MFFSTTFGFFGVWSLFGFFCFFCFHNVDKNVTLIPVPRHWSILCDVQKYIRFSSDLEMANHVVAPDNEEKKKGKHTVINECILSYVYQFFSIQISEEAILHFKENNKITKEPRLWIVRCENQSLWEKWIGKIYFNGDFQQQFSAVPILEWVVKSKNYQETIPLFSNSLRRSVATKTLSSSLMQGSYLLLIGKIRQTYFISWFPVQSEIFE